MRLAAQPAARVPTGESFHARQLLLAGALFFATHVNKHVVFAFHRLFDLLIAETAVRRSGKRSLLLASASKMIWHSTTRRTKLCLTV